MPSKAGRLSFVYSNRGRFLRFKRKLRRRQASRQIPGYSPLVSRLLAGRGIRDTTEMDLSLKGLLPPDDMSGIKAAARLLADTMEAGERSLIVGDFDADGATACALLVAALSEMGAVVDYLVPDRFRYGYGLTPEIVKVAEDRQPNLLVTVDNGISSMGGVALANSLGMKVIITDHHLPGPQLPDATAIVNPNQPGCGFASKNLAGVGVAFYLLSALRAELRERGHFADRPEPHLASYLDLVALGTIADVVALDQNNRRLVHEGLRRIRSGRTRPGILALLKVAGVDHRCTCSRDLAFSLAPRVNAAGRLSDIGVGIECLLATGDQAGELALRLDEINSERKNIELDMRNQAEKLLAGLTLDQEENVGLCLFDETWHQGVVGIIASRIKDKTGRPVMAFANAGNGELKGSGRSVRGFHIRDALDVIGTRHPGLISHFGGHAMAAGLTLAKQQLEPFRAAFDQEAKRILSAEQLENIMVTDGAVGQPITLEVAREVNEAAPWGQGFPEPLFEGEFRVLDQRIVGGSHLKLLLDDITGPPLDAILFNHPALLEGHELRCAFRMEINRHRGAVKPQLVIEAVV